MIEHSGLPAGREISGGISDNSRKKVVSRKASMEVSWSCLESALVTFSNDTYFLQHPSLLCLFRTQGRYSVGVESTGFVWAEPLGLT